jgi:hypothetical protein
MAEASYYQRGLQLYRAHLDRRSESERQASGWDAVVTSAILNGMYVYALDDEIPLDLLDRDSDAWENMLACFESNGNFTRIYWSLSEEGHVSRWAEILARKWIPQSESWFDTRFLGNQLDLFQCSPEYLLEVEPDPHRSSSRIQAYQ